MPNWEQIRNEWETSKITFKALAEKHGVKEGTLKSRRSREKWSRQKDATEKKKDATNSKRLQPSKEKDSSPKKESYEPVVESDDLTDKQRLFCIYYVKSFNQTTAAIKAGYSPDRAHVTGSELVRNRKVADEIRRLKGELQQGVFIDAMDILNKYIKIAFADITDFVTFGTKEVVQRDSETGEPYTNEHGEPLTDFVTHVHLVDSDSVDGTILTEVKEGRDGISVKLADKMKALEMLSKYFDLLSENDKKRLQEEKLKAETQKAKAEAERISKEHDDDSDEIIIVDEWNDSDD